LSSSSPKCLFAVAGAAPATGPDTLEHIRSFDVIHFSAHRLRVHRSPSGPAAHCSGVISTSRWTRRWPRGTAEEARFQLDGETTVAVNECGKPASSARRSNS